MNILEKFLEKVVVDDTTGCHNWTAYIAKDGYGKFAIERIIWPAHRAAWFLLVGDIPEGLHVLHRCDNRRCVNPDHLFLGSNLDNVKDMVEKDRVAKWEEHSQAKLTWEQIEEIRSKYASKKYYQWMLADEYGVSRSNISYIVNEKTWI